MASFLVPRHPPAFGHMEAKDALVVDGLYDVYNKVPMGNCAEHTASKHGVSRDEQDDHCLSSYTRAADSWKAGLFDEEIAPVTLKGRKGDTVVKEDEEYKKFFADKYRSLKPVFAKENGTVTAANSSTLNDGASAVVLASGELVEKEGLKPLAKILGGQIIDSHFARLTMSFTSASNHHIIVIRLRRCRLRSYGLPHCPYSRRPLSSQGCRCRSI